MVLRKGKLPKVNSYKSIINLLERALQMSKYKDVYTDRLIIECIELHRDIKFELLYDFLRAAQNQTTADRVLLKAVSEDKMVRWYKRDLSTGYLLLKLAKKKCSPKIFNHPKVRRFIEYYQKKGIEMA